MQSRAARCCPRSLPLRPHTPRQRRPAPQTGRRTRIEFGQGRIRRIPLSIVFSLRAGKRKTLRPTNRGKRPAARLMRCPKMMRRPKIRAAKLPRQNPMRSPERRRLPHRIQSISVPRRKTRRWRRRASQPTSQPKCPRRSGERRPRVYRRAGRVRRVAGRHPARSVPGWSRQPLARRSIHLL